MCLRLQPPNSSRSIGKESHCPGSHGLNLGQGQGFSWNEVCLGLTHPVEARLRDPPCVLPRGLFTATRWVLSGPPPKQISLYGQDDIHADLDNHLFMSMWN